MSPVAKEALPLYYTAMSSRDWPQFAPPLVPLFTMKRMETCVLCGDFSEVDHGWRCTYCGWWLDLADHLQSLYDAIRRSLDRTRSNVERVKDGEAAAYHWKWLFDRFVSIFGEGQWQRRNKNVRRPVPQVSSAEDLRAVRLCWQVAYGMWHLRLEQVNQWRDSDKQLRPTSFAAQAAAAARIARRRLTARKAEVEARAPKYTLQEVKRKITIPVETVFRDGAGGLGGSPAAGAGAAGEAVKVLELQP